MKNAFTIHCTVLIFNFLASIIQGVTGFGDAVLLHVLWYTAAVTWPDIFNHTPLGPDPIAAVALLMYVRIIFSTPLVAYLSWEGGLFSKTMVLAMAIPSTICAIAGVLVFSKIEKGGDTLKLVLGISSLIFAIAYVFILLYRYVVKQRGNRNNSNSAGEASDVVIVQESTVVREALATSRNASFHSHCDNNNNNNKDKNDDFVKTTSVGVYSNNDSIIISTDTGSPYRPNEAAQPHPTEDNVPPLSPSKLSPSRTMTYTRVRINRNLDENGKIKLTTKIGASVTAAFSGVMGSLTGVGGPAFVIFILMFDIPNYVIRVNFAIQSIPSAFMRFAMAMYIPLFSMEMVPIFVNALIAGYAGVFAGAKLGKRLGPKSYNICVLSILLMSSFIMITEQTWLLMGVLMGSVVLVVWAAWAEQRAQRHADVEAQLAAEREIEANNREGEKRHLAGQRGTNMGHDGHHDKNNNDNNSYNIDSFNNSSTVSSRQHSDTFITTPTGGSRKRVRRADLQRPPSLFGDTSSRRSTVAGSTATAGAEAPLTREYIQREDKMMSSNHPNEELPDV